jgi:hypothetical protein
VLDMKLRGLSFSRQCALGVGLLLLLSVISVGTAFASVPAAGNPPAWNRASFRHRPATPAPLASAREVGARLLSNLTLPSSDLISAGTPTNGNPSGPRSDLDGFVDSVHNGLSGVVRGVYVPGVLALRVVQQSRSNANEVSLAPGTATQYRAASAQGVTGLLADNAASGVLFYSLTGGQEVLLVFGDSAVQSYHVSAIYRFRALAPNDPYSNFVDLSTGEQTTAVDLFSQMYSGAKHVTFQTCIAQNGVPNWGRLFVIATPN